MCKSIHKDASSNHEGEVEQLIQNRISKIQSTIEKRITEFSIYVDKRFAQIEALVEEKLMSKVDALEDIVLKKDAHFAGDIEFGKFRSELAADLDNKIDIKLVEFLATDVRTSFENAMQAFAVHVDDRVQIIEGNSKLVDEGGGGLKVKDNG